MITPADAQLASRDPDLPGLAEVLDTNRILELLRPELSVNWQQLRITPSYIRYKKGTNCLVGFNGSYMQRPIHLYARLHHPQDRAKAAKPLRHSLHESRLGPGGILLEKPCLLFMFFPNDHALKSIRQLMDASVRDRYLGELLSHQPDAGRNDLTLIKYKPERRYVGQIRTSNGQQFLIKAYAKSYPLSSVSCAQDFLHDGDVQLRPRLGTLINRGLSLYPWIPGVPLDAEAKTSQLTRIGVQLARLHSLNRISPTAVTTRADEAPESLIATALGAIAAIAPDQSPRAQQLGRRIVNIWHGHSNDVTGIRSRIHGDFSADQVIVNADQLCFIDFDRASINHPVHDIGTFLARLHHDQINGIRCTNSLSEHSHAFVDGYSQASDWSLADLVRPALAMHLLRLAPESFRLRNPHWRARLDQVLTRIEHILTAEQHRHAA